VLSAYSSTTEAAKNRGATDEVEGRVGELLGAPASASNDFVSKVLGRTTDAK
jgi:hypothetical protein